MKASATLGISGIYKKNLFTNYGLSISAYSKTLGANLNPLLSDVQFDLTNSVSVGGCWGGDLEYNKMMRTINNGTFYNVSSTAKNAAFITTQLILNSSKRNQFVGSVSGSFKNFSFNYHNDGGPVINWLSLGDEFDRWWTGGWGLFFHNSKGYNDVEVSFDQFTGYSPLLYEMSTLLGLKVPLIESKEKKQDFNTANYNVRIFPTPNLGIDFGVVGSLRGKYKVWGFQEITHIGLNHALHSNYDSNRFYLGGAYNYRSNDF